jgi:hypothetical protein
VRCFAISNATAGDLAAAARIINSRLADQTLRPRIGARMPLTAVAEAHRREEAGHALVSTCRSAGGEAGSRSGQ